MRDGGPARELALGGQRQLNWLDVGIRGAAAFALMPHDVNT